MTASVLCVLLLALVTLGQALPPRRDHVSIRHNPYVASTYRGSRDCRGKLMCHDDYGRPICVCASQVCDGHRDCKNGADEFKCTTCFECPAGQFKCPNENMCIRSNQFCDGTPDCSNEDDEQQCAFECPVGKFKCPKDNLCIRSNQFCDGTPDCSNEEDEQQCPFVCPDGQYKCPNERLCIQTNQFCDESPDCSNGEDEQHCPFVCPDGQYKCPNERLCIQTNQFCDEIPDCSDGADENHCGPTNEFCCPDGWLPFQGSCYTKITTPGTFDQTVTRCEALNSTLVEINSQEEYDFLNIYMRTSAAWWIGLTDRNVDGDWRLLSTGGTPDFDHTSLWSATNSEPDGGTDQNCAVMVRMTDFKLLSSDCFDDRALGICEKN